MDIALQPGTLCKSSDEDYIKVKAADGYIYYIAQALADTVLGKLSEDGKACI